MGRNIRNPIFLIFCLIVSGLSTVYAQAPRIETISSGADATNQITDFSQNSFITLRGSALANSTRNWTSQDFANGAMPTQLDGVSVTVDGKPAYISYISPNQVNILTPLDDALGPVSIQLTRSGQASNSIVLNLVKYSPGLFVWEGKWVVATHTDFTDIAPKGEFPGVNSTPASPGETVILWGTGFGPTDPPIPPGVLPNQAGFVTEPVTVTVCGQYPVPATVAIAPGLAGIYQIAIKIPAAVTNDAAVHATAGGVKSNSAVLSMGGGTCVADPGGTGKQSLSGGGRVGP